MLDVLFRATAGLVSETYDAVAATGNYIIDDISAIPDAIVEGWEHGLSSAETTETTTSTPVDAEIVEPPKDI